MRQRLPQTPVAGKHPGRGPGAPRHSGSARSDAVDELGQLGVRLELAGREGLEGSSTEPCVVLIQLAVVAVKGTSIIDLWTLFVTSK